MKHEWKGSPPYWWTASYISKYVDTHLYSYVCMHTYMYMYQSGILSHYLQAAQRKKYVWFYYFLYPTEHGVNKAQALTNPKDGKRVW